MSTVYKIANTKKNYIYTSNELSGYIQIWLKVVACLVCCAWDILLK